MSELVTIMRGADIYEEAVDCEYNGYEIICDTMQSEVYLILHYDHHPLLYCYDDDVDVFFFVNNIVYKCSYNDLNYIYFM